MQVILDSSFAHSGSAPIWGGKKGEFRDFASWAIDPQPFRATGLIVNYNIASRATQSNSEYVGVLKIPIVHADNVSKSLCQNFFLSERPLLARGKILYFATIMDTNRDSAH